MGTFPTSISARAGLGLAVVLIWLTASQSVAGTLPGVAMSLTLITLGVYGLWGVAAAVLAYALLGTIYHEETFAFVQRLGLTAVRFGVMLFIIRRLIFPVSAERLRRVIPLVILTGWAVNFLYICINFTIMGRPALIVTQFNVYVLISIGVQLLIGYAVVIPAYRWLERRGGFDALNDIAAKGVHAARTGIARQREEAAATTARLRDEERVRKEQFEQQQSQAIVEAPRGKKSDFAQANYDVPHCHFQKTSDGFIVTFNKSKLGVHRALNSATQTKGAAQSVGILIGLAAVGAARLAQGDTRIEVTGEAVIIDGKKMSRYDFGQFHVASSYKGAHREDAVATLGYTFGSQSFEFGGAWPERQATEVASSLNHHLRKTPIDGEQSRATPEVLRTARPTDF